MAGKSGRGATRRRAEAPIVDPPRLRALVSFELYAAMAAARRGDYGAAALAARRAGRAATDLELHFLDASHRKVCRDAAATVRAVRRATRRP